MSGRKQAGTIYWNQYYWNLQSNHTQVAHRAFSIKLGKLFCVVTNCLPRPWNCPLCWLLPKSHNAKHFHYDADFQFDTHVHTRCKGCNLKADYVNWLVEFSVPVTLGGMWVKHISHSLEHNILICFSRTLTGPGFVSMFVMWMGAHTCLHACKGRVWVKVLSAFQLHKASKYLRYWKHVQTVYSHIKTTSCFSI